MRFGGYYLKLGPLGKSMGLLAVVISPGLRRRTTLTGTLRRANPWPRPSIPMALVEAWKEPTKASGSLMPRWAWVASIRLTTTLTKCTRSVPRWCIGSRDPVYLRFTEALRLLPSPRNVAPVNVLMVPLRPTALQILWKSGIRLSGLILLLWT